MGPSDRIGRRLKLQDLHVLLTVAQEGSMGKAAQRLHTSQPAISRSIAQLENAFGVRLLDRGSRGIEPTEYGRALLEGGAAVFDDLRQIVKNIEFLADPEAGEVRIGSTVFLAASLVSAVIDRLSRRHPRMKFHLVTGSTEELQLALAERKVDLLIVRRFGRTAPQQLGFEYLFDDAFVVVAGAQNPWSKRRRIQLAELVNESWLLPPPESVVSDIAREAFRASGIEYPRATVVTLTAEVRMSLLATGRFVTILPRAVLNFPTRRADLKVLPVELPMASVPTGIVTLKDRKLSPAARLFIDSTREVAKSLVKAIRIPRISARSTSRK